MLEGYGQTENTCNAFSQVGRGVYDSGTVGKAEDHIEFKLLDVPEMKYTSKDLDSEGRSAPRGEILTRGPGMFQGFYKNPEKT